ncbi:hypothetical protein PanWU01x14_225770 [Parasponia andersonii]|uniref:Uncharacterized protein n=1 Tax=Parasponia andersonii TaxID=3476 RepID=A0A2P5BMG2_PARAD|nr:hypothetical protein PanWU01x14_225770 [Parasponia andersonii]
MASYEPLSVNKRAVGGGAMQGRTAKNERDTWRKREKDIVRDLGENVTLGTYGTHFLKIAL